MHQKNYIKCATHQDFDIMMIYTNKDCKYNSRLACTVCLQQYHTMEGFQDYFQVISNVNNILESDGGPYSRLHPYFNTKEVDFEQLIDKLNEQFKLTIESLQVLFKQELDTIKEFQAVVQADHKVFSELIGHTKFREKIEEIQSLQEPFYSNCWRDMEESLNAFISQMNNHEIQEIHQMIDRINNDSRKPFFTTQSISGIRVPLEQSIRLIESSLNTLHYCFTKPFTHLLEKSFQRELIREIRGNLPLIPQLTLIYKQSKDGELKNIKINLNDTKNMLIICKTNSKYIYGGYSSNTNARTYLWPDQKSTIKFYPYFGSESVNINELRQQTTLFGQQQQWTPAVYASSLCNALFPNYFNSGSHSSMIPTEIKDLIGNSNISINEIEIYKVQ